MSRISDIEIASTIVRRMQEFCLKLQGQICHAFEEIGNDGSFTRDEWSRPEGGGGLSRVLQDGRVFEKAGVNTSTVHGTMPERIAQKMGVPVCTFVATGISLVVHPRSPMVPTVHANYRYFENEQGDSWFGGGADLTPYYLKDEDAIHFHRTLKNACDTYDIGYYPKFKTWCDEYFHIAHRNEKRGIGGIFFDYLRGETEKHFALVQSLGDAFLEAYAPIVKKRLSEPYGERERNWQLYHRGRYAEFNLVYDRGTTFGLETNGRVESILMSLPPLVRWQYNFQPEAGSPEAALAEVLRNPKEWVK